MPFLEENPTPLPGDVAVVAGEAERPRLLERAPRPRVDGERARLRAPDVEGVEPEAKSTSDWLARTDVEDWCSSATVLTISSGKSNP